MFELLFFTAEVGNLSAAIGQNPFGKIWGIGLLPQDDAQTADSLVLNFLSTWQPYQIKFLNRLILKIFIPICCDN